MTQQHLSSTTNPDFPTLVAMLHQRAEKHPERIAYYFMEDGEQMDASISYAELDRRARAIAAWFQEYDAQGERALLLYPPGLEFLAAFFGCLYAGVIAVPAYPPRLNRPVPRIQNILADSGARFALSTQKIVDNMERRFEQSPELSAPLWKNSDEISDDLASKWQAVEIRPETIAFLQYTSGSTGRPKGVILTHHNLMANLAVICEGFQSKSLVARNINLRGIFWLPVYHDMGLIGAILQPMYLNRATGFMSPISFLQRPIRWLQSISDFNGLISGAPNFAYQLCVDKITPEQCTSLNLNHWKIAFCGAEPVRPETLRQFTEKFAPYGFSPDAFYPCYGLAEATLLVTGGHGPARPTTLAVDRQALQKDLVQLANDKANSLDLVGCGGPILDQDVWIVNPDTRRRCSAVEVGEIWVRGQSVAQGYWQQPELSAATFAARTDTGEGPFLRTGDLGFMHEGQLFVTGRLKELIIIRGRNHYPQDIESSIDTCHPALEPGMGAVFTIEKDGEERLVVAQELSRQHRHAAIDEIAAAVRRVVAENHDLQTYAVILLKPLSIPRTSSGKIKRHECKLGFLNGDLSIAGQWIAETAAAEAISKSFPVKIPLKITPDAPASKTIQHWLIDHIANEIKVPPSAIDPQQPFAYFGLDSAQAVSLAGDLETWLGRRLPPTLVWDYPNIALLSTYLAGEELAEGRDVLEMTDEKSQVNAPIAIIGLGCRFPGADNPESFWELLRDGVDAIREVPADRWPAEDYYAEERAVTGKMNTRWGGFLDQVDQFDPHFFGISPREASRIDPQQRLLMEVTWEALEHAGQAPGRLAGSHTGVFIGISSYDYSRRQFSHPDQIDAYAGTGNAHSIAANRISYLLDLRGPSLAVDTACSSSLVAVHQAMQSLRSGESDMALAGGVNVILEPDLTIFFSQARAMAGDGRCKAFDARADGYVRSEGCGVVVLKRLEDANRDGDQVMAVIYGSAVNQDGRSNGLTAPNSLAQQEVIRQALHNAGIPPAGISYIEAHGTGTPLGDPIEIQSIRAVYETGRDADNTYYVGSVKSNVGHLEAAAGIAGLIKSVLALQHDTIPPHLHLQKVNPYIDLQDTGLAFPTTGRSWPRHGRPRLAGVSSFGFGGTNAHLILGDAPVKAIPQNDLPEREWHLLPLSAPTPAALESTVRRYTNYLENATMPAAHIVHTAATGRDHYAHRLAVLGRNSKSLYEKLRGSAVKNLDNPGSQAQKPKIAFLFTGAGPQYAGMGQTLYETNPYFRATIDECAALVGDDLDIPLQNVLFPELFPGSSADIDDIYYTQPALFALEYALARLWQSWGVTPDLVLGHSTGEVVAACFAGVFSLADGLKLIAARARLMAELPPDGGMAAVYTAPGRIAEMVAPYAGRLAIATINGPDNVVISGATDALDAVLARCAAAEIATQRLSISQAAHSPLVRPMLAPMSKIAGQLTYHPPQIPLVTNLSGRVIDHETPGLEHWQAHLTEPVQFMAGMEALAAAGVNTFIEIGPQPTLLAMGRRCLPDVAAAWLPSLRRKRDDWQVMLDSLGALYAAGVEVQWAALDAGRTRHKVALPTTPFQRERYWFEPAEAPRQSPAARPASRPHRMPTALPIYEWLTEAGPAAFQELVQYAARDLFGPGRHEVLQMISGEIPAGTAHLQVFLTLQGPDRAAFQIYHRPESRSESNGEWNLTASGQLRAAMVLATHHREHRNGHAHPHKVTLLPGKSAGARPPKSLPERIQQAASGEKVTLVEDYIHQATANVLGLDPERLGRHQPLDTLGMDSLMAMELKTRLERELAASLPVVRFLEGPTVSQLARQTMEYLEGDNGANIPPVQPFAGDRLAPQPLSYNQQALWFLHELLPAGVSFNVAGALEIQGPLNVAALRTAFTRLMERHATLRLTFHISAAVPVQQVQAELPLPFQDIDAAQWTDESVRDYVVREAYRPFNLESGPVLRLVLLRRPAQRTLFLLVMDHIIVDLWSLSVLVAELYRYYQAEIAGESLTLPPLDLQYSDYAHWERELVNSDQGRAMRDYWKQKLAGRLPVLNLSTDRPRPAAQTFNGETVSLLLDGELTRRLQEVGQSAGATLYMTMLAAFQTLMHRYTNQEDLLVGTVLAGRDRPELAGLLGYFINPLAMRADFSRQPTFAELLAQTRQDVLEAIENQHYPLPLLADQLDFPRDPSRPPIFETMFIMQKAQVLEGKPLSAFAPGMPEAEMMLGDLQLSTYPLPGMPAQFDLTLMVGEMAAGLGATLHYNTDLFDAETMQRMLSHFQELLAGIVADPHRPVSTLPLLPAAERTHILRDLNQTDRLYTAGSNLPDLVHRQAQRTPRQTAVQGEDHSLTYAELDQAVTRCAAALQAMGIRTGDLIGIGVERTPDMVIALLGILRSGAAYIPLDPAFPAERLAFMLSEAQPALLITDQANRDLFAGAAAIEMILLDELLAANPAAVWAHFPTIHPESLAYIIYTSGSTGRPKGVQIPHRAVANFLATMADRPGIAPTDNLLAVTTLSFDIAVLELFLPLVSGATVTVASQPVAMDGVALARLMAAAQITIMQATPTTWQMLLAAGWSGSPHLQKILCGGEALPANLARRLLQTGVELWNMYGPTETTVWSTTSQVTNPDDITIGRPVSNTLIFILDSQMQLLPAGVPGDLYIGGDGVAHGYLHRPALTAARFVPNPFATTPAKSLLYKTGDKAAYRADGTIRFLGRDDYQVKLRGFRIELGDIESTIARHPAGAHNVVVVHEDGPGAPAESRRLVAYFAPPPETAPPTPEEWHAFLRKHLPEYMIPASYIALDNFPLTPNGKINRRALPAPSSARPELFSTFVAPRNEQEKEIACLLADLLTLDQVGIHDNFFDLGGNSLLATRLIFQVNGRFGVQVPLRHLFAEPTVAGLARAIQYAGRDPGLNGHAGPPKSLFGEVTLAQLQADARLDAVIDGNGKPVGRITSPDHILLTGVTGFLGAYLLHELLQETAATIHCLVRADDDIHGRERLQQNMAAYGLEKDLLSHRVQIVSGDLGKPHLGLPAETFQELAVQIDAIYHNGAMVNFVYTYDTHKLANVYGTREILRLAATHKVKAVHFVSTLSVLHTGEHDDGTVYFEDTDMHAHGVPFGGYAQSKWVAEEMVREAGRRHIPTAIYRPGLISGDSETGVTNTADLMSTLGRACLLLGAIPALQADVDIVPVDYVSRSIVYLSLCKANFGKTFHLANPERLPFAELRDWVQKFGFPVKVIPFEAWRDHLLSLAAQMGGSDWSAFLPLLEETEVGQIYLPRFDCQNTIDGLTGSNITCAPVSFALLGRYIAFFQEQGFLQKVS